MKKTLFVVMILALGGCSILPKAQVETRYTLGDVTAGVTGQGVVAVDPSRTIRVLRPDVPVAYRDTKMVLLKDGQQTFYAGKAWDAPLPDLIGAAMGRDLPNALPGWTVAGEGGGLRSAYELQTEVHTFATVEDAQGPSVVMKMDVRLVEGPSRKLVKVLPFDCRTRLESLTMSETLAAYNKGWSQFVEQVGGLVHE